MAMAAAARSAGTARPTLRAIIVPSANAAEAAVVEDLDVIAVIAAGRRIALMKGLQGLHGRDCLIIYFRPPLVRSAS